MLNLIELMTVILANLVTLTVASLFFSFYQNKKARA